MSKPSAFSAILFLCLCAHVAPSASAQEAAPPQEVEDKPIHRVPPEWPRRALDKGLSGFVRVVGTIGPDGRVTEARAVEAQPPGEFNAAVLRAVKQWLYAPLVVDGVAVARPFEQLVSMNNASAGNAPVTRPASTPLLPLATARQRAPQVAAAWARDPAAVDAAYQRARAFCPDRLAASTEPADAWMPLPPVAGLPANLAEQPTRVNENLIDASRCLFTRIAQLRDPEAYAAAVALLSPQAWDSAALMAEYAALAPAADAAVDSPLAPAAQQALAARVALIQRYATVIRAAPLRAAAPAPEPISDSLSKKLSEAQAEARDGDHAEAEEQMKALLPQARKASERAAIKLSLGGVAANAGRMDEAFAHLQDALQERALPWSSEANALQVMLKSAHQLGRQDLYDQTLTTVRERVILPVGLRL